MRQSAERALGSIGTGMALWSALAFALSVGVYSTHIRQWAWNRDSPGEVVEIRVGAPLPWLTYTEVVRDNRGGQPGSPGGTHSWPRAGLAVSWWRFVLALACSIAVGAGGFAAYRRLLAQRPGLQVVAIRRAALLACGGASLLGAAHVAMPHTGSGQGIWIIGVALFALTYLLTGVATWRLRSRVLAVVVVGLAWVAEYWGYRVAILAREAPRVLMSTDVDVVVVLVLSAGNACLVLLARMLHASEASGDTHHYRHERPPSADSEASADGQDEP